MNQACAIAGRSASKFSDPNIKSSDPIRFNRNAPLRTGARFSALAPPDPVQCGLPSAGAFGPPLKPSIDTRPVEAEESQSV